MTTLLAGLQLDRTGVYKSDACRFSVVKQHQFGLLNHLVLARLA